MIYDKVTDRIKLIESILGTKYVCLTSDGYYRAQTKQLGWREIDRMIQKKLGVHMVRESANIHCVEVIIKELEG